MPVNAVPAANAKRNRVRNIAVLSHYGDRVTGIAAFGAGAGFATAWNIAGRIDVWSQTVDPDLPR